MKTVLSAVLALGAAALFGVSSVLQQRAARGAAGVPLVGVRVVRELVHHPRWLMAVSLAGVSFGVQALALVFGPLVLVQPLAGMDLLFALPFLVHRQRRHLGAREWSGAGMVAGGVGVFLAVSPPAAGAVAPGLSSWAWVLGIAGGAVAVMVPIALGSAGVVRTALLACAGAVVFALGDALTKAVVGQLDLRGWMAFASWEPYVLGVVGLSGMVLAQGAFRSGSLLTSLPIIDTVEPVGAVVIGATVFAERIGGSPVLWSIQMLAAAVAVAGIVLLDRSPLVAVTASGPEPPDAPG